MVTFQNVTTLYVSQQEGEDKNSGYLPVQDSAFHGPFKTLEKAFLKVADIRCAGGFQPITIKLMGEGYFCTKPVTIRYPVSDVTIEPYRTEKFLISGGRKITGFQRTRFNGTPCLGVYLEDVKNGKWNFSDLYVGGKRADFTRYPKEGFLEPVQVERENKELFYGSDWFIAKEGDIWDFKNMENCIISFCHYWIDEHTPIECYDKETRKVTFQNTTRFTIDPTTPQSRMQYYVENVAELFLSPNQWYLDKAEGMLYYIPEQELAEVETLEVYAPVTDKIIQIEGNFETGELVENIRFHHILFAHTKGEYQSTMRSGKEPSQKAFASDMQSVCGAHGSINLTGAVGCEFSDCTLQNFGVHGIVLEKGCSNIRIEGNTFFDGGAGAIRIDGTAVGGSEKGRTFGNTISNNKISYCGRRYFAACGVLLMHTYGNTVSNNDISYLYYTGISAGWVWGYAKSVSGNNLLQNNLIHHLGGGVLSDLGGIYLLGKQRGTIVRGNIIHDIKAAHYGGWGIYTDEGSSYILVEGNICYSLSHNCYHQHYGAMNTVRNNIFAFAGKEIIAISRSEAHLGLIFENNILITDNTPLYTIGKNSENGITVLTEGQLISKNNIVFDINHSEPISFVDQDKSYSFEEAQTLFGLDEFSVICDPGCVDVKNFDFTLKETAAALLHGFRGIDARKVGIIVPIT